VTAQRAGLPSAPRDQAERYLFTALPGLAAQQRRALALAELSDANRVAIASEVGVAGSELAALLASGRKELRRSHVTLGAGGRCERTELLISEAADRALTEAERARHDAHLKRCPRCREHVEVLEDARAALRAGFAASQTVVPEPIAERAGELRVVPLPAPAAELGAQAPEKRHVARPVERRPRQTARRRWSPALRAAGRSLVASLVLLALIAAIFGAASALDNRDDSVKAPWSAPSAPVVKPAPLNSQ
jgi:hypothetical protein